MECGPSTTSAAVGVSGGAMSRTCRPATGRSCSAVGTGRLSDHGTGTRRRLQIGMPDVEIKAQRYRDERPEEYFRQFHERARQSPAGWTYELTRFFVVSYSLLVYRLRAIGSENVPNGPVILAPNHASFMYPCFGATALRR